MLPFSSLVSRVALVLVSTVWPSIACKARDASDVAAAAEITIARSAFSEAHARSDAQALADLFTEDARLLPPGGDEVRGRAAIRAAAQSMFSALTVSDFKIEAQELQIYDSVAYELATYTETLTPRVGPASPVRGRYLIVWRRDPDRQWRVDRNMFHFISGGH